MKLIRIILSPLVFVFWFFALSLFPGPLALIMGVTQFLGNLFIVDKTKREDLEWEMIFCWFFYPYICAKQFIQTGIVITD